MGTDDSDSAPELFAAGDGEGELDAQDVMILELLVEGRTHADVARAVGVSTKTVQRRVHDDEFAARLRQRRRARIEAITIRLVGAGDQAVATLVASMESEGERVRIQASRILLELASRFDRAATLTEFAGRLERLEEQTPGTRTPGNQEGGAR